MKMIANTAIATGTSFDTVGNTLGRLYGMIQSGSPGIDRYVRQLMQMKAVDAGVLADIKNAQKSGESPAQIWDIVTEALQKYQGYEEAYVQTAQGRWGQIKVDIEQAFKAFWEPMLPAIEPVLAAIEDRLRGLVPIAKDLGLSVAGAIEEGNWDQVWKFVSLEFQQAMDDVIDALGNKMKSDWTAAVAGVKSVIDNAGKPVGPNPLDASQDNPGTFGAGSAKMPDPSSFFNANAMKFQPLTADQVAAYVPGVAGDQAQVAYDHAVGPGLDDGIPGAQAAIIRANWQARAAANQSTTAPGNGLKGAAGGTGWIRSVPWRRRDGERWKLRRPAHRRLHDHAAILDQNGPVQSLRGSDDAPGIPGPHPGPEDHDGEEARRSDAIPG